MKQLLRLSGLLHKISHIGVWIASIILFGIAVLIFVDVIGRYVFNASIVGSQEIVELAVALVLYFGLSYSTHSRAHVRVDALVNAFSERGKRICLGLVTMLCMLVSGPIAVQMFRQAAIIAERGAASNLLHIPHWPLYCIVACCNVILTFEFLCDGIRYFGEAANCKNKSRPAHPGQGGETA
jgi:TRAP-type C4-dicarboxylate transport system permease small subunit